MYNLCFLAISRVVKLRDLNQIFEDRFVFEEGAYRAYVTDEKTNIDQKDIQISPILRAKSIINSAVPSTPNSDVSTHRSYVDATPQFPKVKQL